MNPDPVTSKNTTEYSCHKFCTDASMLGLAPGQWPVSLETSLGNGLRFFRTGFDHQGAALYSQALGCITLTVFNS